MNKTKIMGTETLVIFTHQERRGHDGPPLGIKVFKGILKN